MMLAGASVVGLGSVVRRSGPGVFSQICDGIQKYLERKNIENVSELVGIAH
jgi:dihydroorotate dehydrogenase (NAD+) catalytic subunit